MIDGAVPRLDLRLLRQFVAVAEELHFHRAAARLAMSQPPLTAAIRHLEAEVGAVLIERGHRTVRLTAAGAVLLVEARRLLAGADEALSATRAAAAGMQGRVRLGYVGSAMYGRLPAALRGFRKATPGVHLDLREMTTVAQVSGLRVGEIDLAIVIPPLADDGGLAVRTFDSDRLAIALPVGHPLASKANLAVSDLRNEPFVSWPREQGRGFHDRLMRLCTGAAFAPLVAHEAHGMHAVLSLVAVEAGVAIVPASMASIRPEEIVYRPIPDEVARFELVLARLAGDPQPATAQLEAALHAIR